MTDPSLGGQEGAPAAPTWGAPAAPARAAPGGGAPTWAPVPLPGSDGSGGMRTTILCAVIMIGVVFGVNVVNAAVPLPQDPGFVDPGPAAPLDPNPAVKDPGQPQPTTAPVDPGPVAPGAGLQVGAGIVIYPPDGWTALGTEDGVTVLQKGAVVMIAAGIEWGGTPLELAAGYRDAWFEGGQFAANDPESGSVGNGVPGAALSYSGILDGTQVEGIIVVGAAGGAGVILNAFGAQGSIDGVSDDLNAVFGTVQFTRGQG